MIKPTGVAVAMGRVAAIRETPWRKALQLLPKADRAFPHSNLSPLLLCRYPDIRLAKGSFMHSSAFGRFPFYQTRPTVLQSAMAER